ncbi:hypothetical protein F442_18926 [Phytophthora nicotianae P10297]|uniref:Uncharacterized protein n=1 Tax=Phytophthora nicotianae P10297 TaxID=1317064 RepID=W2YBI7_PHYNI|nr:hypothetical protein F442_18926 [Phytophthora nicotianae P10297]
MTPSRSSIEFLLVSPQPRRGSGIVTWLRACLPPGTRAQSRGGPGVGPDGGELRTNGGGWAARGMLACKFEYEFVRVQLLLQV